MRTRNYRIYKQKLEFERRKSLVNYDIKSWDLTDIGVKKTMEYPVNMMSNSFWKENRKRKLNRQERHRINNELKNIK